MGVVEQEKFHCVVEPRHWLRDEGKKNSFFFGGGELRKKERKKRYGKKEEIWKEKRKNL